jgi:hypothetical protein
MTPTITISLRHAVAIFSADVCRRCAMMSG